MKKTCLALFAAAVCATVCTAQTMYLNAPVAITQGGKFIGTAALLSPVQVLSSDGKTAKLKLSGFVNESYQEEIVASMSARESYAQFAKNDAATFAGDENPYIKKGAAHEDDYGEPWFEASVEFSAPASVLAPSADELYQKAKSLYEQTCSACHHLHATTEYTANQWPSNVQSMISSGFVELSEGDLALIVKYLQHHAKK